jgi:glutamine synthetase type III
MAKKVTVDNLQEAINDILDEYQDKVYENLDEITQRIGKKGVEAVKNASKDTFNGKKYASGWAMQAEKNRLYTTVVIYNKKQAGLAHLLENGHVKANGTGRYGQWDGRSHILPVEEKLIEEYESEVANNL